MKKIFLTILITFLSVSALLVGGVFTSRYVTAQGQSKHTCQFGEWTITKEPTFEDFGIETRVCSCGKEETREIAKLANKYVGYWTDDENTWYVHIDNNNTVRFGEIRIVDNVAYLIVLQFETIIEKINIENNIYYPVFPPSEATAYVEYNYDTDEMFIGLSGEPDANIEEMKKEKIPFFRLDNFASDVVEHFECNYEVVESIAPTCTENGHTKKICSICGSTQILTINSLGHDYVTESFAPTCTECGYTKHTCSRCGDTYDDEYIEPLVHEYLAEVIAPTCTKCGYTMYYCPGCYDTYFDAETESLGHDYSSDGVCSRCNGIHLELNKTYSSFVESVTYEDSISNGYYKYATNTSDGRISIYAFRLDNSVLQNWLLESDGVTFKFNFKASGFTIYEDPYDYDFTAIVNFSKDSNSVGNFRTDTISCSGISALNPSDYVMLLNSYSSFDGVLNLSDEYYLVIFPSSFSDVIGEYGVKSFTLETITS